MYICKGLNFGFSMWSFLKIKLYQEILKSSCKFTSEAILLLHFFVFGISGVTGAVKLFFSVLFFDI